MMTLYAPIAPPRQIGAQPTKCIYSATRITTLPCLKLPVKAPHTERTLRDLGSITIPLATIRPTMELLQDQICLGMCITREVEPLWIYIKRLSWLPHI